jgi:hypothetical protein
MYKFSGLVILRFSLISSKFSSFSALGFEVFIEQKIFNQEFYLFLCELSFIINSIFRYQQFLKLETSAVSKFHNLFKG